MDDLDENITVAPSASIPFYDVLDPILPSTYERNTTPSSFTFSTRFGRFLLPAPFNPAVAGRSSAPAMWLEERERVGEDERVRRDRE